MIRQLYASNFYLRAKLTQVNGSIKDTIQSRLNVTFYLGCLEVMVAFENMHMDFMYLHTFSR